jgi:8-amino-3,8-dideoxy-alpha-D-manno-octulosonate transaminase
MYHFINQWNHLKELKSAAPLPIHLLNAPQDYLSLKLPKSQEVIGRLISFGIRVTWTAEEIKALAASIKKSVQKVLSTIHA